MTIKLNFLTGLAGLKRLVRERGIQRFAIANPGHAPYGRAAKAVLRNVGIWDVMEPRLVIAANAAQAAQYSVSGSVDGGLIPLSVVRSPRFEGLGEYAIVESALHREEPLRQRMALLKTAGDTASAFYDYLLTPAAGHLLHRYGLSAR